MNRSISWVLVAAMAATCAAAQDRSEDPYASNRAIIVVTGMRLNEDPAAYEKDLSVAKDAVVQLVPEGGKSREKRTEAFQRPGRGSEDTHYTADFEVDLETTYTITMTFQDGTVIRIEDYRLPKDWKTHFYFHSTNGTLSPASVLRVGTDEKTGLRCHVYAVYPLENYHRLGGRQIEASAAQ